MGMRSCDRDAGGLGLPRVRGEASNFKEIGRLESDEGGEQARPSKKKLSAGIAMKDTEWV